MAKRPKTSKRSTAVHSSPRLIPQLPDEISILCIARVPRFLHPNLAFVSRSWRSLLKSPLIFAVRSDLGISELSLCVVGYTVNRNTNECKWCLLDCHPQNPRPFLPLPLPPINTFLPACASVGSTIVAFGGYWNGIPSLDVQIFDARLKRWSIGPRMTVFRESPTVGVIGNKIYVFGGCNPMSDSCAEVLDLGLGVWTPVPIPAPIRELWDWRTLRPWSAVLGGKLLVVGDRNGGRGVIFDPEAEPAWSVMSTVTNYRWCEATVIVDDVLYPVDYRGKIRGYDDCRGKAGDYDLTVGKWKNLEGLDKKLAKLYNTWLANVGGILCAISMETICGGNGKMITRNCGKVKIKLIGIKVSKNNYGGLCGSVMWKESVILPQLSSVTHCLGLEF